MDQRGYMDSDIENQLMKILNNLDKVEGIDGSLIVNNNGSVLCHTMSRGTDTSLFGPMAHVITSSSKRLLNSVDGGEIQRVLVESCYGKALFLHLENTYFVVLIEISANVGLAMVSAKRAAREIMEITRDIVWQAPVEEVTEDSQGKAAVTSGTDEDIKTEIVEEVTSPDLETVKIIDSDGLNEIPISEEFNGADVEGEKEEFSTLPETKIKEAVEPDGLVVKGSKSLVEISQEAESQEELGEQESAIPVIKPPISFPKLPDNVEIPEGDKEKSDLILDIYESIFLAMSIGASKIMGVTPARGLIRRFLPLDECKTLLNGVDVKNNSVVDFDKIRENMENIPLTERKNILITDFSKIISIITENYGKVMGFSAFRGIVRKEFRTIDNSYGIVMNDLGIKGKIHPELMELFK